MPEILSLILWIACEVWIDTHISLATWLAVPISLMCSFVAHVCRWAGDKKLQRCSNSLSPWKLLMLKALYLYLVFIWFNPGIISGFPLLLHAWTDLKYIFFGLVCRKGLPLTKQSMAISTFWSCLATRGGKGILVMLLFWYGILLIFLPCMMGIWGPYMDSDLLISSVVIGQLLILFF